MPVSPIATLTLLALLAAAAYADVRTRRIPNRLTAGGLLLGLVLAAAAGGWTALGSAAAGAGVAFATFFALYAVGGMGAGDVKLAAAAGAFLGFPLALWGLTLSALAGGVLALGALAHAGAHRRWILGVTTVAAGGGAGAALEHVSAGSGKRLKVPYGIALACGFAAAALFPGLSLF